MDKVGLVFVPLPGMGHLVPMVELAKRLLHLHHSHSHSFTVTILNIPPLSSSPQTSSYISSLAASGLSLNFRDLPPVDTSAIQNEDRALFFAAYLDLYRPLVKSAIEAIKASSPEPVAAIVLDFFLTTVVDVAEELGIAPYIFFTSSAAMLGLMLWLPTLGALLPDGEETSMDEMQGKSIDFPGFRTPLPLLALPEGAIEWKGESFAWFAGHGRRFLKAKGIIINTFVELEGSVLKALEDSLFVPDSPTPPVFPIGPIISIARQPDSAEEEEEEKHECVRWLDEQPQGSVVFLCFGSMGSFSTAQARDIAAGLERSGHRFLWVIRSPGSDKGPGSMRRPMDSVLEEVLPDGFVGRMKERGMVWPSFAPQKEILAHRAVGGFVTHCGWNSTLEGLWFGVPMGAWPLYAEQHLNAHELTREIGVAVAVMVDRCKGNAATAEEVERSVRCLMGEEGRGVREKVKEMRENGRMALEEGGPSFLSLQRLAMDMVEVVPVNP